MASPLYPRRWNEVETVTISYGQGISVNPLAFAAAAAAVVNGGTLIQPDLPEAETRRRRASA